MKIMKISKLKPALKKIKNKETGKTEEIKYGWWVTIRSLYGASDKFVVSERNYPSLHAKIENQEIKEGDNLLHLLEKFAKNQD